jgi:hypothetical protein
MKACIWCYGHGGDGNEPCPHCGKVRGHVWDAEKQECSCQQRPCPEHEPYATWRKNAGDVGGESGGSDG